LRNNVRSVQKVSIAQVVLELYKFYQDIGAILTLLSKEIYKLMSHTVATQVAHNKIVPVWGMMSALINLANVLTHLCVTSHIQGQLVQYATRSRDIILQANKGVRSVTQIKRLHLKCLVA
jgi:hypothetical protein